MGKIDSTYKIFYNNRVNIFGGIMKNLKAEKLVITRVSPRGGGATLTS